MFNLKVFYFLISILSLVIYELTLPFFLNQKFSFKYNANIFCGSFNYFFKKYLKINMKLHNNLVLPVNGKNNLLMMNHTSYLDWVLLMIYLNKKNIVDKVTFIAKKSILFLPFFGQQAKNWNIIFIERSWEKDKYKLQDKISKLENQTVIIFPEGTRKNKKNYLKSVEFSKKNNYPVYKNLLLPRTKGSWKILNILKDSNKLDKIIDLTFVFPKYRSIELSNKTIFSKPIGDVFMIFEEIKIPQINILSNQKLFKKWLFNIWKEKDFKINNYEKYQYNDFNYMNNRQLIYNLLILLICIQIIRKFGWKYLLGNFLILNTTKLLF